MSNLATIGWPSGTDTGWPSEPRNMLPGRIEGYPQGSQRSANTAERLLSQAVGWWDAAAYRDGDRLLRNRGVAGELLDLQLGSSDRVATTNDPLFLAPEDQGYVYLPGVAVNVMIVPDENALDITGDIDLRVQIAYTEFPPSINQSLLGKITVGGNQQSYDLRSVTGGTLQIRWSPDGSTVLSAISVAITNIISIGAPIWLRVTLDVDNGSSGHDIKFFTSDDGVTWTQLGTTNTQAGTTSIFASTSNFQIGARGDNGGPSTGKFYRAEVWDGIEGSGGTKVLDVDCDAITDGSATSFQAVTGQTVTINRSTSGRKSVAVPRRNGGGRSLFLFGTDDYMQCVDNWQHQLLNFDQQDSFTVVAVVRQWATPTNFGRYVDKRNDVISGYSMASFGTTIAPAFTVSSNSVGVTRTGFTFTAGTVGVLWSVANQPTKTTQVFTNNTGSATTDISGYGSMASIVPMRIGRRADTGSAYQDFELLSAAIFRKALTLDEIKTVTDYYQNRGY